MSAAYMSAPQADAYTTAVTPYDNGAARAAALNVHDAMGVNSDADNIVYTVQNTSTERCVQETEFGGVLTIITTTVTRTITERVLDSEDEDSDDELCAGEGAYLDGIKAIDDNNKDNRRRGSESANADWTHRDQRRFYSR